MYIGIDLGSASVKVMLLDAQAQLIACTRASYALSAPQPGWAETDPRHWLEALGHAMRALPPAYLREVRAIGFSGQMHGVVLCDAHGEALRPAILWMDLRAADMLSAFPVDTAQRTGNPPAAGMAAATLAWLARHEPHHLARARWALQPKDWLRMRLGGGALTDPSDASGTLLADREGQWELGMLRALSLPPALLPPVLPSTAQAGTLNDALAREWGLPAGVCLVVGAADTAAAALGTGLLREGQAQLTTGTGGQIVVMRAQCPLPAHTLNTFRSASPHGYASWYTMAAMQNVGVALEWVRALFGYEWEQAYECLRTPHRGEAIFLPYLAGERTPLMNPQARGAWQGLSLSDDRPNLMRAAFEGVAFSLRAGWQALQDAGSSGDTLQLAGGGSGHPLWSQLLADVLGVPLLRMSVPDASARGAALLAGLGAGGWGADALEAQVPFSDWIHPGDASSELLARFERFERASAVMHACAIPQKA